MSHSSSSVMAAGSAESAFFFALFFFCFLMKVYWIHASVPSSADTVSGVSASCFPVTVKYRQASYISTPFSLFLLLPDGFTPL